MKPLQLTFFFLSLEDSITKTEIKLQFPPFCKYDQVFEDMIKLTNYGFLEV